MVPYLKLHVVVDNEARPPFVGRWGLSIYLETPSWKAFWDANSDARAVKHNARLLNVPLEVDYLIFSHRHWDHTGGAEAIRAKKVIAPDDPLFPIPTAERVPGPLKLDDGLYLSRTLEAEGIRERALVVDVKGYGQVMLVGCSHPGVHMLYRSVVEDFGFRPRAVIGGFHLASKPKKEVDSVLHALYALGAEEVHPIHCSGNYAKALAKSDLMTGSVLVYGNV
ncbi:MBL fold metallo-hydrolase [Ignicoccus hospitalis]|uniref:Metal-dependent hydrolase of the beta-lactamase superfamily II-like protein n=1 Tax=Ignicoccus hospitalis (strain KIN4/I / DSM 18386 / JCM 14125) TaxID=453591 RepID=A8AB54_IGNH4|nr:MBL fold metallo-hydrolase [Ignicoccus hospitalis]ABU82156.1 Metal-dependent hydrolase of the beta-lactamase superfamily II-like protein [Ignicoccus hospitalis KIN4/I]HIH91114.1 MBL fold metallo-hydrolase [Desulfurococcaceae archaeon]